MHIAENAPTTQFTDEPVIREELAQIDTEANDAAEREADTAARVGHLRQMVHEFAALRSSHERLMESLNEFGKALERLENADVDA
jgi:hypothetical protein